MIDATASFSTVAALLTVVSLFNHTGELVQQLETLSSTLQRWTSEPPHGFLCVSGKFPLECTSHFDLPKQIPPHRLTCVSSISICPSLSGASELRHNQMEIIVSGSVLHFYTYSSAIYLCGSSKRGIVSKIVGGCNICPCFHS